MIPTVLDANVVISGTILSLGASAAILRAWRADLFDVVTCPQLLEEIAEKLALPRIQRKYGISDAEIISLLLYFGQAAHLVPAVAEVKPPPPDPDDTMLFAAAIEANAAYIVTGDKPVLGFNWDGPAKVVSPKRFWEVELPAHVDPARLKQLANPS